LVARGVSVRRTASVCGAAVTARPHPARALRQWPVVDNDTAEQRTLDGAGMNLEFGVFDHLDRNDLPLREYYEQRLKVIEAFDRSGFYAYHVAEHHFTPLGMAPSPSVFLSAIAQRTTRLRFGTFVYALPLHHPLRVLEEICMLDHMSGGRLEIGFGRGSVPFEISYYGQSVEERQQIYAERCPANVLRTTAAEAFEMVRAPWERCPPVRAKSSRDTDRFGARHKVRQRRPKWAWCDLSLLPTAIRKR
jgi:alkanesulfonate monooxygenase SsuD/methylene tetrahydromethanopterin reductase-like flavin-dependent oxidoreductase (luciferase family)